MNTKTIVCQECGKEKAIYIGEYNRKIKLGTPFYCSRSCFAISGTPAFLEATKAHNTSEATLKRLRAFNQTKQDNADKFSYFLKNCRKRKKKEFNITADYLREVWALQEGKCAISGVVMEFPTSCRGFSSSKPMLAASLDRINSSSGYIEGNVQFICVCLNYMKNDWNNEEFLAGFDKIVGSYLSLKKDVL
jgi:hypothetical protein